MGQRIQLADLEPPIQYDLVYDLYPIHMLDNPY
jgi:hypothetical protein